MYSPPRSYGVAQDGGWQTYASGPCQAYSRVLLGPHSTGHYFNWCQHITSDFSSESEVKIAFSSTQDRLGSGLVTSPSKSQRLTTQIFLSFSHCMSNAGGPGLCSTVTEGPTLMETHGLVSCCFRERRDRRRARGYCKASACYTHLISLHLSLTGCSHMAHLDLKAAEK